MSDELDLEARAGASAVTPAPVGDSLSELQQPLETVGPPAAALPVPEQRKCPNPYGRDGWVPYEPN